MWPRIKQGVLRSPLVHTLWSSPCLSVPVDPVFLAPPPLTPTARQTLLFSATLPSALIQFTRAGLKDPEVVRLDVETKVSENLKVRPSHTHSHTLTHTRTRTHAHAHTHALAHNAHTRTRTRTHSRTRRPWMCMLWSTCVSTYSLCCSVLVCVRELRPCCVSGTYRYSLHALLSACVGLA